MKSEVDQHYQSMNSEADKLQILKAVFDMRRQKFDNFDQEQADIQTKLDNAKVTITEHTTKVKSESDNLDQVIQERSGDIAKLGVDLSTSQKKNQELYSKSNSEQESIDKKFVEESNSKISLIQDLLNKVNNAKFELQKERKEIRMLEYEFDGTLYAPNQIQDLVQDINSVKDPRHDPSELKRAEEENKVLKDRLTKLEQNKDQIGKAISTVDDEIYKLNKQKIALSDNQAYNHQLKIDRDEIQGLVENSCKVQKELYDDNIEKLRQIKALEVDILSKDKEIMKLVTYSTISNLQDTLTSDLKDRLKELEEGIDTVDKGTNKLDKAIDDIKPSVENEKFIGPLNALQGKVQDLNSRNGGNSGTKDQLVVDVAKLDEDLSKINPATITPDQIDSYKDVLGKIEGTLSGAEELKDQHIEELNNLNGDFDNLKKDICDDLEAKFKDTQKKDELLIDETDKNYDAANDIINNLSSRIEPDNPYMRKFARKLNDAKATLAQVNSDNGRNKNGQDEQSGRRIVGDDYFLFLYKLTHDQADLDEDINDNKNRSDELMNLLKQLQDEFDEANCQTKDELINELKKNVGAKLDELAELEPKMKKLETGTDENTKTSEFALKVLDKNHPDYNSVVQINEDLKDLGIEVKNLRADKDDVANELQRIMDALDDPELRSKPMSDIVKLQEDTNAISDKHKKTSDGIDQGLDSLKDIKIRLDRLLENIRNKMKQDTDDMSQEIQGKLDILQRFLKPTMKTADSIQRPQKLSGILGATAINPSDEEYGQFQEYTKLTSDNLLRCNHASGDLDILNDSVSGSLRDYSKYNPRNKGVVEQIQFIQEYNNKLGENQEPSSQLNGVVDGILTQLDGKKEQEILSFLSLLKLKKLEDAQKQFKAADLDLNALEKRLREVNSNNEGFMNTLNAANNDPKNKEKVALVNTLLSESEDSKKSLKHIRTDKDKTKQLFETMNQKLSVQDSSKINIKDMDDIMVDLDQCQDLIKAKMQELDQIDNDVEERKKRWRDFLANTEAKDKLIRELISLIPLLGDKYERMVKNYNFSNNSIDGFILVKQKLGKDFNLLTIF